MTDQTEPAADVPCKIATVNGRTFIVEKVGAWTQTPTGVFATGRWAGSNGHGRPNEDTDVLIPYPRVDHIEFDYVALQKHLESQPSPEVPHE